ncbi:MAG: Sec-independent protein translocase protein TatB [Planctomycetes bacterium]|nr:Sec-independent protein translocase protein TatB [Planctomycetota bacterium]
MDIGWGEIMIIVVLALLVYGGELPTVARSVGRSLGAIRKSLSESTSDVKQALDLDADGGVRDTVREVRRFPADQPAPPDVATEDVSAQSPPADVASPAAAEPSTRDDAPRA